MRARVYVDGIAADRVSALDRGLLYGDGLFETVLFVAGAAPLWPRHLARLQDGAQRLNLPLPPLQDLHDVAVRAAAGLPRAAVRISVTRGTGERGYAPPAAPVPCWIVGAGAAPA
ncbi:aminotransferase class IV, partial [Tahibacter caeni]|uniref:aminotransferase class IV n=1 Tax=Tahibacter caeni TaxID=1453545 RepID=UPI002147BE38